jgi:hypothetical protein
MKLERLRHAAAIVCGTIQTSGARMAVRQRLIQEDKITVGRCFYGHFYVVIRIMRTELQLFGEHEKNVHAGGSRTS